MMEIQSCIDILSSDEINLTFENERISNPERYHTEEEENGEAPKDLWQKRYLKSLNKDQKMQYELDQNLVIETQSAKKRIFQ